MAESSFLAEIVFDIVNAFSIVDVVSDSIVY